jgi:hypothetical protein
MNTPGNSHRHFETHQQSVSLPAAQWFRAIDRDGNGTLDSMELQRALALGNLHFSLQATSHMIRCGRLGAALQRSHTAPEAAHCCRTPVQTLVYARDLCCCPAVWQLHGRTYSCSALSAAESCSTWVCVGAAQDTRHQW